jgi:DNA-binding MarR family transcriptional regulator
MTEMTELLGTAEALVRLSHMVQHVFADVSREHTLTPQQTQLLCRLARAPIGMSELAVGLHLERPGLSGLVDRVERRGLVERIRDPHDRRAWHVALTPEGQRTADSAHQTIITRLNRLLSALPQADRDALSPAITTLLLAHTATSGITWLQPPARPTDEASVEETRGTAHPPR